MSTPLDAPHPTDSGAPTRGSDLEALSTILREVAWVIHRSAPERAGVGPIPTTEIALLKQVLDAPGSTVGELSQALGLRQPNTSAAITGLVRRGLVSRAKDPDDRRITRIMPTPAGAEEHGAISDAWRSPLVEALGELDPDQRRRLTDATAALAELYRLLRPGH
ncbi:winged helix-turn-helix transcriptional regulator [Georgenia yuyongxinii]|uniref:Winged helix-turn-helix transcriptional regulator n=1 Tax=Georgenia yuyongxinii TaxID=2589797 RepID=A0A5B8C6H8_9MICO|nr:MarR family winged helix-turn-helix transcriptional regulator [Georgenia yuyongxinii]QDC26173.1 winged helix-turn-helix transcriptional regulator [Georgenia yuyongxinii]